MYLLAQAASDAQNYAPVGTEWTAFGLLVAVLLGVGKFLHWYIPQREKAFSEMLAAERAEWKFQLSHEQGRSERIIADLVNKFERANDTNVQAIREVRDSLTELHKALEAFKRDKHE